MFVEPETVQLPVTPTSVKPHPVRRIGGWVGAVGLIVVIAAAVAVAVVPALAGATPLTVLSGSMEPTLPVGSTVVVRPRPVAGIVAGDVITFTDREPGTTATRIVTHRVAEVLPGPSFRTKGDANNAPDQRVVAASDVHGVLWYDVPLVGLVKDRLFSRIGLFFGIGIVLLVVAAHLLLPAETTATTASGRPSKRRRG